MKNPIKFAKQADLFLGVLFTVLAIVFLVMGKSNWAGIFAISAAFSFVTAKLQPAKWLLSRMLTTGVKRN
jgi:hypothetical protein